MVLHHKMSETVKIKVNRYTNIYFLMNLYKINQFILIFSFISALLSLIEQKIFFNHFVVVDSLRLFMVERNYIQSENINFTPIHRAESKW